MATVMQVLHVLSAVFLVGPMAILPMTAMRAVRAGNGRQVSSLAKSTFVFSLLSILTLIFGFGLQGMWKIPFSSLWVWLSIVLYVIAVLLSLFVVVPSMRRAARVLESRSGGEAGEAATTDAVGTPSGYGAIAGGSGIVTLLLLATVVLMVVQPG